MFNSALTESAKCSYLNPARIIEILLIALVYVVTAKLGQILAIPPGNVTPVWIPSGIMLALALIRGVWIWPGIALGAFIGNVTAYFDAADFQTTLLSLFSGTMNGAGDAAGIALACWIITRYTQSSNPLHNSRHTAVFISAGALLSSVISATVGVTGLAITGFVEWADYDYVWITWSIGDASGVLLIGTLILSFFGNNPSRLKKNRKPELLAYTIVLITVMCVNLGVFSLPISYHFPLFIVVPVLIWSVLRLCEQVTFISLVIVASASTIATSMSMGPFAFQQVNDAIIDLQLFIVTISITLVMLNAVVRERQAINEELSNTYDELENIVKERTRHLSSALDREKQLNHELKSKSTELRQTQKQLLHSQKMDALGTMAGGIAHDFNNILNAIIGNAELAMSRLENDPASMRNLNAITNASFRAAKLVKQVLTFSRIKSQHYTTINLVEIAEEAVRMSRSGIPSSIDIDFQSDKSVITIKADETSLQQVIINLCTNSYHAIGNESGQISVQVFDDEICPPNVRAQSGRCAMLVIKDNGSGMDETILERIFDPFFTTREVGQGTGLGLSVVHGIIESHGGAIKVVSEPDIGTCFRIYLPLTSQKVTLKPDIIEPAIAARGKTILIVDDDQEIVDLYHQYLKSHNFHVISTSDPEEALQIYIHQKDIIDLIITDQSMPGMTGKELSQKLLQVNSDAKIILASGYSDVIDEEEASLMGIYCFIDKPVKLADLKHRIDRCFSLNS